MSQKITREREREREREGVDGEKNKENDRQRKKEITRDNKTTRWRETDRKRAIEGVL